MKDLYPNHGLYIDNIVNIEDLIVGNYYKTIYLNGDDLSVMYCKVKTKSIIQFSNGQIFSLLSWWRPIFNISELEEKKAAIDFIK